MSKHITLNAQSRARAGKGDARATRREGRVPAVIYGDKKEPISVSLDRIELEKLINTGSLFTHICDLKVGNDNHLVLARDVQYHPVTDVPLHTDFLRVTEKTRITVDVPVHFLNEEDCKGVKAGGILSIVRRTVELSCRANAIPESIEFDLTTSEIGDTIRMSDFNLPNGVEPSITDRDFTVANIAAPKKAEEVEEETDAPEDVEVEAINQKDDDASEGSEEEKSEE